jgi:hypothetical protein
MHSSSKWIAAIALTSVPLAASAQTFMYTDSLQTVTLAAGAYDITAFGATGGSSFGSTIGGTGAAVSGDITFSVPTTLDIVVGGAGLSGNYGGQYGGSGGGGTFVFVPSAIQPLFVAGGGGGAGDGGSNGVNGQTVSNGSNGLGTGGGAGGTNGSGGAGGISTANADGGGGAGWLGNGTPVTPVEDQGAGGMGPPTFAGGLGCVSPSACNPPGPNGGYGGGGGAGYDAGGGGGGYSGGGGGGANDSAGGGGGGSYLDSTVTAPTGATQTNSDTLGNGEVIIQTLSQTHAVPEIDPASATSALTLLLGGLAVLRGRRSKMAA